MNDSETNTETPQVSRTAQHRRPLPWWGQFVVLLVVFSAGGLVGAMIATKFIHSRVEYYREHADALPRDIVPRLQGRLGLTDEQTKQVREIVERRHSRLVEYRHEGALAMLNEFRAMEDEVADVLNSDQQPMWRSITSSVRERFLPPAPGGISGP